MIPIHQIEQTFANIFSKLDFSDKSLAPSEFAEKHIKLDSAISSLKQGAFSYSLTPYLREVVDCASPYHPAKMIAVIKAAQIGYALDIRTPIITPSGWIKMGDLKAGDYVYGDDGNPTKIIYATDVMYNHECYEVEFSDKTKIVADKEHLWEVYDQKEVKRIYNTENVFLKQKTIRKNTGKIRNTFAVKNCKPLKFKHKKFEIDPYVLGYWIGDGCVNSNRVTCSNLDIDEVTSYFEFFGESCVINYERHEYNCGEIVFKHKQGLFSKDSNYVRFGERMNRLGIYGKKIIPNNYLYGSQSQRQKLLQGLMDSDGSITKGGTCEFYSIYDDLTSQVYQLICSLGYKATIRKRINKDCEIVKGKIYKAQPINVINFYAFSEIPIFRLKRKKDRLKLIENTRNSEICRRRIKNVVKIDSVPVRCISIDNESKLFLAGKSMIPTHNSQGVIVPAIVWKIANNPGNIVSLSADAGLSKKFVEQRLDPVIQRCYVKDLIKPNVIRKRNSRTGDTSNSKEFAGGSATFGGLQSYDKMGKQMSFSLGFYDDWDAAKIADKEQGNTFELLRQRFSSAANSMKQYFISTPQTRPSNIEIMYEMGDKRKWNVPCPCCGEYIEIVWHGVTEDGVKYGITFQKNEKGKLIENSVGYTCQKCFQFFTEKHKYDMNLKGKWIPTAEPSMPGFYSYHISALCAAPGMFGWTDYAYQWIRIYENSDKGDKGKLKVFKNVVLGEAWEDKITKLTDIEVMEHTREYEVSVVPSSLSEKDGNDKIILLTFSCDLNGTENDARLDWEVMAHSCSGSTYSIEQGSVGTYQPGLKHQTLKNNGQRELFTYNFDEKNSVWSRVEEVLLRNWSVDDGRVMKIAFACIDSGYMKLLVYRFVEKYPGLCVAIKGTDPDKYTKPTQDLRAFKISREKPYLYLLEVDRYKDDLSENLSLKWDKNNLEDTQPQGYVNFPTPNFQDGKYTIDYFKQFSAEEKELVADENTGEIKGWKWTNPHKKANHFWDVCGYNYAARDIFVYNFIKAYNLKKDSKLEATWYNFSKILREMF